jgi:glycosyltransferase domain-containing protein
MQTKNDLTIILLLKERPACTELFLKHFCAVNPNFNLFISDGSKFKLDDKILKKIKNYKNITYKKFPEDKNINIFYNKILLSLKKVKTEYVLLSSNDDFHIFKTIQKCLFELKKNKNNLIGCGGSLISFKLKKNNLNLYQFKNIEKLYFGIKYDQKTVKGRINNFLKKNTSSLIHYIIKRKVLLKNYNEAINLFKTNIHFKDIFSDLNILTMGRVKILNFPILLHQSEPNSEATKRPYNLLKLIKQEDFIKDLQIFINIFSKKTKIKKETLMQLFYNSSILKFNRNLVLPSEPSIKEITQILLNKVIKKINYKKNIFKEYNSKYLDEEIKKILEIIN